MSKDFNSWICIDDKNRDIENNPDLLFCEHWMYLPELTMLRN